MAAPWRNSFCLWKSLISISRLPKRAMGWSGRPRIRIAGTPIRPTRHPDRSPCPQSGRRLGDSQHARVPQDPGISRRRLDPLMIDLIRKASSANGGAGRAVQTLKAVIDKPCRKEFLGDLGLDAGIEAFVPQQISVRVAWVEAGRNALIVDPFNGKARIRPDRRRDPFDLRASLRIDHGLPVAAEEAVRNDIHPTAEHQVRRLEMKIEPRGFHPRPGPIPEIDAQVGLIRRRVQG